jgi:hypothetical protein
MDRPPLSLPLPRPGEAIVATALAGALGLATWVCVPFVAVAARLVPIVAMVVTPVAFHWLRRGLMTEENSPEREFNLPSSSTAVRIGVRAFAYAPLAAGTICVAALLHGGSDLAYDALLFFFIGATTAVVVWGPITLVAVVAYGLPLGRDTAEMDAAYPDVVDRALVGSHRRLAIGAALALVVGAVGFLRAPILDDLASGCFATFLLLAAAAIAVPVGVALRAHRRLAGRNAWTSDLTLVPIADQEAERLGDLPVLGTGAAPTHALVRVAAVEAYRIAATPEEPIALVAVAEDARATDTSAKAR